MSIQVLCPFFGCAPRLEESSFPDWRLNLGRGPWQRKFGVLTTGLPGNSHLCSFLVKLVVLLLLNSVVVENMFWLSSYIICKHFLSLCRLSLHLLIMSFMYTGFNADEIQLVISIVSACAFGVASKLPVTSKVVCNCSMFPSRVLWF